MDKAIVQEDLNSHALRIRKKSDLRLQKESYGSRLQKISAEIQKPSQRNGEKYRRQSKVDSNQRSRREARLIQTMGNRRLSTGA